MVCFTFIQLAELSEIVNSHKVNLLASNAPTSKVAIADELLSVIAEASKPENLPELDAPETEEKPTADKSDGSDNGDKPDKPGKPKGRR